MPFTVEVHPDEPAWLDARARSIGGSEIVDLLGIEVDGREPRGLMWLWLRKNPAAWQKLSEERRAFYLEIDQEWQKYIDVEERKALEPVIEKWAGESEVLGDNGIFDPGDYCILRDGRRHCSPDGVVVVPEGIGAPHGIEGFPAFALVGEASYKTLSVFARRHWGREPSEYAIWQAQWTMMVTGWEQNFIFAHVLGGQPNNPRDRMSYVVEPIADLQEVLAEASDKFWEYVDQDKEPPVDGFEKTTRAIRLIYKSRPKGGRKILLPADFSALEIERREIEANIKREKRRVAEIKQKVEITMAREGNDVTDAVVPVSEHLDTETLWRRQEITNKPADCPHCGEEIRPAKSYTKIQPLKG